MVQVYVGALIVLINLREGNDVTNCWSFESIGKFKSKIEKPHSSKEKGVPHPCLGALCMHPIP